MVDFTGWIGNLTMFATDNFSAAEAFDFVKPLLLFVIGIVIYSIFIFKFYRFIAKRDMFKLHLDATGKFAELKKNASRIFYGLKHMVAYPIIVMFYFLVIVAFFAFLAKTQPMDSIMLIAMALVASIRITAYYNEDLSKDLAKMIPFALLGVFLVDISYFSFDKSLEVLFSIPSFWKAIIYYLAFAWLLEIVLRMGSLVIKRKPSEADADEKSKTKKEKSKDD